MEANRKQVLAVVGAIATSVGVAGFMGVVGGAVLWIRFDKLAIPADKAVSAVPSAELVVIGLSALLPYVALAILFVFLAYLFAANSIVPAVPDTDVTKAWTGRRSRHCEDTRDSSTSVRDRRLSAAAVEVLEVKDDLDQTATAADDAAQLGSRKLAESHSKRADELHEALTELLPAAAGSLDDAEVDVDSLRREGDAARKRAASSVETASSRVNKMRTRIAVAAFALIVPEMVVALLGEGLPLLHIAFLLLLSVILAIATGTVGWRTRGFALFGAAIFITVIIFGAARTLMRTWDHPKLQPIALIRSGPDKGMVGYYISETSDRVYMARLNPEQYLNMHESPSASHPRILVLPRTGVIGLAIGPLMERRAGLEEGKELLKELCSEKVAEPTATGSTGRHNGDVAPPMSPCPPSETAH